MPQVAPHLPTHKTRDPLNYMPMHPSYVTLAPGDAILEAPGTGNDPDDKAAPVPPGSSAGLVGAHLPTADGSDFIKCIRYKLVPSP